MATVVQIPHNWTPRPYQKRFCGAFENMKFLRYLLVWHRRAGKDLTVLNKTIAAAHERIGTYYHCFPKLNQGRKVLWDGKDKNGRDFMSYFPPEIIAGDPNQSEMRVELKCGSAWQIIGADNFDAVMGTNPIGIVFSEFSLQNPLAWDYFRPILAENGGWAVFPFTPRGRNHAYSLHQLALANPHEWFTEVLTVDDTGAVSQEAIDAERRSGMSEEMIQQEFYCSYNAPQRGAYYGREMTAARNEGRIRPIPHDANYPVHTFWDLGISDYMVIWFVQLVGPDVRVLGYHEDHGYGIAHYVRVLDNMRREQDWLYGEHWAPHDIEARELTTGTTRRDTAYDLGIDFRVVRQHSVSEGIEAVRQMLPRCWFNSPDADLGVSRLESYRHEYDAKKDIFLDRPLHDAASHGADAFRTLAMGLRQGAGQGQGAAAMTPDTYKNLINQYCPVIYGN